MKKICVALISLCLILCSMSGCGKSKPAQEVEELINSIGAVTADSGDKILAAEDYYKVLTNEQKNEVENYKVLVDARKAYNALFYFKEYPKLKRPDTNMYKCPLIDEKISSSTTTYIFSLGDDQIESIAIAKAEEYIKMIEKDGFNISNGIQGYYMITHNDKLVCTFGLNAIEDAGYCMLFLFSN